MSNRSNAINAHNETLILKGFSLTHSEPSVAFDKDWGSFPMVCFGVTLKFRDRVVITTPYRMGIGHLAFNRIPQMFPSYKDCKWLRFLNEHPHQTPVDKDGWIKALQRVADRQHIQPDLADVLMCLVMDGAAHFDHLSFEDWCGEFGYDTDSRKAEETYRTCVEQGRALAAAIPADLLATLREDAANW